MASAQRGTTGTQEQGRTTVVNTVNKKQLPVARKDIQSMPLESRGNGVRKCNKECHTGKLHVTREQGGTGVGNGKIKRGDGLVYNRIQVARTNREVLRRESDTK